jgi:hypothetical protein
LSEGTRAIPHRHGQSELAIRDGIEAAVDSNIILTLERAEGGPRATARTSMAGEEEIDIEPTVRRWLALAKVEPRPIGELNRIVARLAKFSRAETCKLRRRIATEPGPAGDRQAIVGYLSLNRSISAPLHFILVSLTLGPGCSIRSVEH